MGKTQEKVEEIIEGLKGFLATEFDASLRKDGTGDRVVVGSEEWVKKSIKSLIIEELEGLKGEEFQKTFQGTDGMSMKVYAYNSGMVDGYNESTHEHNQRIQDRIKEYKEL